MKKSTFLPGLILLISMAVFNVAVFLFVKDYNGKFVCGYVFTMAAFLLQILFAFLAFGKADTLKKVFYGIPIARLGLVYLILQVIWGFIVIFIPGISAKAGAVTSAVLLGFYLIAVIIAYSGREIVTATDEKVKAKTFYIKSIQTDVELLAGKTEDALLKKQLKDLADTVKYSDPMSSEALFALESKIVAKVAELSFAVESKETESAGSLIGELQMLFSERNKKCKLLK